MPGNERNAERASKSGRYELETPYRRKLALSISLVARKHWIEAAIVIHGYGRAEAY